MTSTNEPERIALCIILLFTALGITLANATTEDNYKNDVNLLPSIYESTHKENGYKANIIINPHTTGIYTKENGYNLDLAINPQGIGGSHSENNHQLDLIPEKTFPRIPDLAITNVRLSKTVVGQGSPCKINATVSNKGLYYETFYVTLYANTTTIKTQTITLTSKDYTTTTFTWNTTDIAKSNYTITAKATPITGEIDTTDNAITDGWIVVTLVGDVDGDYYVGSSDVFALASTYGIQSRDPNWNPNCDLNSDDKVDASDLFDLSKNYGKVDC